MHGRATGVHGRAPQAETRKTGTTSARPWIPSARPCACARVPVRPSGLRVLRFSAFLFAVFLHFWGISQTFLEQILGKKLGLG